MTQNELDELVAGNLPLKPVDFLVLAILQDGPRHGYGLVQEISARTRGQVSVRPGDLYRVLYRMVRQGLVAGEDGTDDDDRRRDYHVTDLGRRVARAEAVMLSDIIRDIGQSADTGQPGHAEA
jgi:DNA-binding PadR family transcriptional regulator